MKTQLKVLSDQSIILERKLREESKKLQESLTQKIQDILGDDVYAEEPEKRWGGKLQLSITFKESNRTALILKESGAEMNWYGSSFNCDWKDINNEYTVYLIALGKIASSLSDKVIQEKLSTLLVESYKKYEENVEPARNEVWAIQDLVKETKRKIENKEDERVKEEILKKLRAGMVYVANPKLRNAPTLSISKYSSFEYFWLNKETNKKFKVENTWTDKLVDKNFLLNHLISAEKRTYIGYDYINHSDVEYQGFKWMTKEEFSLFSQVNYIHFPNTTITEEGGK